MNRKIFLAVFFLLVVFFWFLTPRHFEPLKIHHTLSLEEKAALLFALQFRPDWDLKSFQKFLEEARGLKIKNFFIAGLEDSQKIKEKTRLIQKKFGRNCLLLIDQENGRVFRAKDWETLPSNLALGAAADPDLAEKTGELSAKIVKALGFNGNLAPDLDIYENPFNRGVQTRSFGNREKVFLLGPAFLKGAGREGVVSFIKHFPVYSASEKNPDAEKVVLNYSWAELLKLMESYRNILTEADGVLISHIFYPRIDPVFPASASKKILTELFRKNLGYSGVLAVEPTWIAGYKTKNTSTAEMIIQTISAGADLIFAEMPEIKTALPKIIEAAQKNPQFRQRIEESSLRILNLYQKLSRRKKQKISDSGLLTEIRQLSRQIAEKAVVLLKNENAVLPLTEPASAIYLILGPRNNFFDYQKLAGLKTVNYYDLKENDFKNKTAIFDLTNILAISRRDLYSLSQNLKKTIKKFKKNRAKIIIISTLPELGRLVELADAVLITFGNNSGLLDQALKIMAGETQALGQLPVPSDF